VSVFSTSTSGDPRLLMLERETLKVEFNVIRKLFLTHFAR